EVADGGERIAEQVARAGERAEQIADHGKPAALDVGKVNGRPLDLENPPVDSGRFQVGVDFLLDTDELSGSLQVGDALAEAAVTHTPPCPVPGVPEQSLSKRLRLLLFRNHRKVCTGDLRRRLAMRFSRILAVIVGILAPVAETVRRWSTWQEDPPAL